jgi:hypothetical protein
MVMPSTTRVSTSVIHGMPLPKYFVLMKKGVLGKLDGLFLGARGLM